MPSIGDTVRFEDNGEIARIVGVKSTWLLFECGTGRFKIPMADFENMVVCGMVIYP